MNRIKKGKVVKYPWKITWCLIIKNSIQPQYIFEELNHLQNFTIMKRVIVNSTFLFLLAGLTIFVSSFTNENSHSHIIKEKAKKNPAPFMGKFSITTDVNGIITGSGIASHIGRFTWTANDNEETFPVITGTQIITAANGDQIFITHTGYVTDLGNNRLQADFNNDITGGTGRFKGATGNFQTSALVTETSVTGTINGTIDY